MLFRTHLLFAILVALLFVKVSQNNILFILIVIFSSIIPDIDAEDSFVSNKIKVTKPLNFIFGHRKIFHSLTFAVLVYIALIFLNLNIIAIPFFIGYCSHLVLDALTLQGIMLFYPLKFRIKGFLKTGGWIEELIFAILVVLDAMIIYFWF